MDLLPTPGFMAPWPRLSPLPQMRPVADDGDVFDAFAPDQAVVEMAVAEILVLVPLVGLGQIVSAARRPSGGSAAMMVAPGVEVQRDVALQMDGIAQIIAGREMHRPAARRRRGVDGLVDGGGVERLCRRLWRRTSSR